MRVRSVAYIAILIMIFFLGGCLSGKFAGLGGEMESAGRAMVASPRTEGAVASMD